jgi:hypothetical protein
MKSKLFNHAADVLLEFYTYGCSKISAVNIKLTCQ